MSVSVADLLRLPSLRKAQVVAGKGGLQRIVSSISVLESGDPALLNDALFVNDEFFGSEIVITGFLSIRDNVELQCENVRRLAECGEVGIILFYVGAMMKEIAPELIRLADSLDFTLICMPRNRMDLRYSEVICEVMDAISRDQAAGSSMVVELLERVSRLAPHQQNLDTVAKMLSDRLRATVILTDVTLNVLNEAAWPRTLSGLHTRLNRSTLPRSLSAPAPFPALPQGLLYRATIETGSVDRLELFLIREQEPLDAGIVKQAAEIIRLAARLWSQQHGQVVIAELVNAILQNEPLKMRRLAELFRIDIASINTMWLLKLPQTIRQPELSEALPALAAPYCHTAFADWYEGKLVLFMDGPLPIADAASLGQEILSKAGEKAILSQFAYLKDTAEVREAFLITEEALPDAERIFPGRTCYSGEELRFVKSSREIVGGGEEAVARALQPLNSLEQIREAQLWLHTLGVYLLDCNGALTKTAELLFLHKNTVKYRLKCISDRLGFRVGDMPASAGLYQALAIMRILAAQEEGAKRYK